MAFKVKLIRGKLSTREWGHDSHKSAMRRVDALCQLHGCQYTTEGNVYIVDASDYYGRG